MKTYASYREAVGSLHDKQRLIAEIPRLDAQNLLLVVAMLNNPTSIDGRMIIDDFVGYFAAKHPKRPIREILFGNDVLFHPQGLLNVAKWLIAYGDFGRDEPVFSQQTNMVIYIRQAIELCMIISDYADERMDGENRLELLQADLLRSANFYNEADVASVAARTLHLLDDLSYISERYGYNYKEKFWERYHYTLLEYVALLFSLYSIYLTSDKTIQMFNVDNFFSDTRIPERGRAFFDLLVCHPLGLREWALGTINNAWEFRKFWSHPLMLLPCGRIHPVFPLSLVENLYIDLEIKIYNLFRDSGQADDVKAKLGLQFEQYVCGLASETFNSSKYVTQIIPEFTYGPNKSPDFMLLFGDKMLAIEVKSYRPTADFAFGDDPEQIQNGVNKIIVKPLNQAIERLSELMDLQKWNTMDRPSISEIYVMVVTLGGITTWESNEDYIRASLVVPENVPLAGYFHVDIREFELLCELSTRRHAKPLLHYLKRNNPQKLPFGYFLRVESLAPRRPKKIKALYEEKMELIRQTLFGNKNTSI